MFDGGREGKIEKLYVRDYRDVKRNVMWDIGLDIEIV